MTEDYGIRAVAEGAFLRAIVANTTQLNEEARARHDTYPTATAALGRLLAGAAMLGMTLKETDKLILRIKGDGPLGQLVAVSRAGGYVKGYVNEPHVHLPLNAKGKLDVGGAVGAGMLYLTKDIGLKEPYTGSTPLVSGEIAEDLTNYFAVSEQTPSAIALGVLVDVDNSVKAAGGFLVQLMPGTPDWIIDQLEENLGTMEPVSDYFNQGKTPEELLAILFNGFNYEILEKQPLKFLCDCNMDRMEQILISLGKEELLDMAEVDKGAEVSCHYCNSSYRFSEESLKALAKGDKN